MPTFSAVLKVNAFALASFFALLMSSCSSSLPLEEPNESDYVALQQTQPEEAKETVLKPGDAVEIFVTEDPTFNGSYVIRNEGHIIFPTFGRFHLAGLTPKQAEAKLKNDLQSGKLRVATVILDRMVEVKPQEKDSRSRLLVYLTGKVFQPGQHSLFVEKGKSLGVYEAIMISGGFGRFADLKKAYLVRTHPSTGSKRRLAIDLEAMAEGRKPDLPIYPGDVVVVPEKTFGF